MQSGLKVRTCLLVMVGTAILIFGFLGAAHASYPGAKLQGPLRHPFPLTAKRADALVGRYLATRSDVLYPPTAVYCVRSRWSRGWAGWQWVCNAWSLHDHRQAILAHDVHGTWLYGYSRPLP